MPCWSRRYCPFKIWQTVPTWALVLIVTHHLPVTLAHTIRSAEGRRGVGTIPTGHLMAVVTCRCTLWPWKPGSPGTINCKTFTSPVNIFLKGRLWIFVLFFWGGGRGGRGNGIDQDIYSNMENEHQLMIDFSFEYFILKWKHFRWSNFPEWLTS